eukprot:g369.t1
MAHEWDLEDLNAIDQQLASTPKATMATKRVGRRGSLMSNIENQIVGNNTLQGDTAAGRRKNRSSGNFIDSDDEELLERIYIYLLDGTQHQLKILPTTTTQSCLMMLRDMLHLQNDADFALFVIKNGLLRGTCNILLENEKPLQHTKYWTPEQSDPTLLEDGDLDGKISGGTRHLLFRRRIYLPWSPIHDEVANAASVKSAGHMLEYIESVHNVMYGHYSCDKQQIMELAGYMLQSELGDFDKGITLDRKKIIRKLDYILPGYFRENRKMAKYADRAIKQWKSSAGLSPLRCQQKYIAQLKTWFAYYGCDFFPCNYKRSNKSGETHGDMLAGVLLAVGHNGIYVLYRTSGKKAKVKPYDLLASHAYRVMHSWSISKSEMVFSFGIGNVEDKDDMLAIGVSSNYR